MGHFVYMYVYKEEILYVGKNDSDLISRLDRHGKNGDNIPREVWDKINNCDIYYCKLPNKTMSDVVETEMIRRHKPKYNKAKTSEWCGIKFVEPEWIKIKSADNYNIFTVKERNELYKTIENKVGELYEINLEIEKKKLELKILSSQKFINNIIQCKKKDEVRDYKKYTFDEIDMRRKKEFNKASVILTNNDETNRAILIA